MQYVLGKYEFMPVFRLDEEEEDEEDEWDDEDWDDDEEGED